MKKVLLTIALFTAGLIEANTYPLQFSPTGHILYVAGYTVTAAGVTGECDYVHVTAGSGRGGRTTYTYYKGACAWDLFGRLTASTFTREPGVPIPTPPVAISIDGTTITYAADARGDKTGQTARTAGFVYHASSDYTWQAAGPITVGTLAVADFHATLTSTGDRPLWVSGASGQSTLGSAGTPIKVKIHAISCAGKSLPSGSICTISGTYDDAAIVADDPIMMYDTLSVHVTTNSGDSHDFSVRVYVAVSPQ